MLAQTRTWLFLCLLLPALLASKCDDPFGAKPLKKNGLQEAKALVSTPDGGAIVVGQTSTGENNYDLYVLKVDSVGEVEWSKTFGGELEDTALAVERTADGAYLVVGYIYEGNTTVPVTLFKMSGGGSVLWQKQVEIENVHLSAITSTADGGFVLAGHYRDDITETKGFATVRLNALGEVEWHNVVALENPMALVRSISETADGGFVLAGTVYDFGKYDHQIVFYKTDEFGDILWSQEYGNQGVAEEAWSVASTADGGFVVAGNRGIDVFGTPTPPQIAKNALVIKVDADGRVEWERMYGGEPEDSAYKIRTTSDGGFVFAGLTRSYGFQNNDAWVVKLDAKGNQQWHAYYPGDATVAEAVDVEQLSDGTYIATGKILHLIRNWDIFVWHIDEDGSF